MIELSEFRETFINDIEIDSENNTTYPETIFVERVTDILINDFNILSDLEPFYFVQQFDFKKRTKGVLIYGGYFEEAANTIHLLTIDYNSGEMITMQKDEFERKINYLKNYFELVYNGFFINGEKSDPAVQFANTIRSKIFSQEVYKINCIVATTNKFTGGCKTVESNPIKLECNEFKVDITSLDIEAIYKTKLAGFKKEPIIINTIEFGLEGIPCIEAKLCQNSYQAYLGILPGEFLSEIYKKYNSRLLEDNVRSFLNFKGGVNKGIRGTILNNKDYFFAYNNGISATAESIETKFIEGKGLVITSFKNFQIINGGQTTASLASTSIKDKADLKGIYIQMKLTIAKNNDSDFISNVAKYANSQNKVTNADLNSNHRFYVKIEDFSRKTYTPKSGQNIQTIWFFERARGQYDQKMMQMTKAEQERFKTENPKNQKFTKTDLAKYVNSSRMKPFDVSWGAEVNATKFYSYLENEWEKNENQFNEYYYKKLIGMAILYNKIEKLISSQDWYRERNGYRSQLVTYTFSKLVYEADKQKKLLNYIDFWNKQDIPSIFNNDIINIAKICFDIFYKPHIANISTYCKKEECWSVVKSESYTLSEEVQELLITFEDEKIKNASANKSQKIYNEVELQVEIFNMGEEKLFDLKERGLKQGILNPKDESLINSAIKFAKTGSGCSTKQLKLIWGILQKLSENGIN